MTEKEVIDALIKHRFQSHTHGYVTEFKPSSGFAGSNRRIDLYAIECAPSKGCPKHAVEVKVSRQDWLNELKQPMKRRMAMDISNYFWFAAPVGIIKKEELPPQCGLIEVGGEPNCWGIYPITTTHPAEYRDPVRPTWSFVATLMRRMRDECGRVRYMDDLTLIRKGSHVSND
jgi:hypothetical protein